MADDSRFQLLITPKSLAMACFVLVILVLVDASFSQFQMFATGGRVLIPPAVLKLIFAGILLPGVLWQPRSIRVSRFSLAWLAMTLYLLADAVYLLARFHTPPADLALYYNGYYTYFFVCPLAVFLADQLNEFRATKILFWVFAVCFVLGMAQFILQKPLVYTESSDGSFSVLSSQFGDEMRVFSLFIAGAYYGLFCCLIGSLSLACVFLTKSTWRRVAFVVFISSAIACATTLTRNCYLQFFFCSVTVFLLAKKRLVGFVKYLPVVFLLGAAVLAWRGGGSLNADGDVTSNATLLMRLAQWVYYLTLYANAPLIEKAFGPGIVYSEKASYASPFLIDNEFIAILVHVGLIGIALVILMQWMMWIRLYKRSTELPTAFTVGMAAFSSTVFATNFYNIATVPYCVVFVLAMMVRPSVRPFFSARRVPRRILSSV